LLVKLVKCDDIWSKENISKENLAKTRDTTKIWSAKITNLIPCILLRAYRNLETLESKIKFRPVGCAWTRTVKFWVKSKTVTKKSIKNILIELLVDIEVTCSWIYNCNVRSIISHINTSNFNLINLNWPVIITINWNENSLIHNLLRYLIVIDGWCLSLIFKLECENRCLYLLILIGNI